MGSCLSILICSLWWKDLVLTLRKREVVVRREILSSEITVVKEEKAWTNSNLQKDKILKTPNKRNNHLRNQYTCSHSITAITIKPLWPKGKFKWRTSLLKSAKRLRMRSNKKSNSNFPTNRPHIAPIRTLSHLLSLN
jgi:predicted HNH restriction endonuclease